MGQPSFDATLHVVHMERLLGLDVQPEWRDGVISQLEAAARMAELVLTFPLADDVESASVFEAGR